MSLRGAYDDDSTDYTATGGSYEDASLSQTTSSYDETSYEYDDDLEAGRGGGGSGKVRSRSAGGGTGARTTRVPPVDVAWNNVTYEVDVAMGDKKKKNADTGKPEVLKILQGCSGRLEAGTMTALIGASGAGKSTLLNYLSGRLIGGRSSGDVTINGKAGSASLFREVSEFVIQDDVVPDLLTAKETFTYAAKLRLPQWTAESRDAAVDELLQDLGLWERRDTIIGIPGLLRGLSGGERKRVNIGTSMISEASLLMLDEPTSGLDSNTAHKIMRQVKGLAEKRGMTVLSTIHQPSVDIINEFDQVIVLARGKIVFAGRPDEITDHFKDLGFPCRKFDNPTDHALKLLSSEGPEDREANRRIDEIVAARDRKPPTMTSRNKPVQHERRSKRSQFFAQFGTLISRNVRVQVRNPMLTRARAAQTIIFALLIGFLFFQLGSGQTSVQGRLGAIFIIAVNTLISALIGVLFTFPAERALFIRERSDGIYSTLAYYLAKVSADLPYQILFPTIFAAISYWMVGFQSDFGKFVVFSVVIVLLALIGSGFGFLVSGITGDVQLSLSIAPGVIMPCLLFSGFLANLDSMTPVLSWIGYINPVKWAFAALSLNEFRGLTIDCSAEQAAEDRCVWTTGEQVIAQYDLERDTSEVAVNIAFIIAIAVFLRIAGYVGLLASSSKRIPK
jgi:ABC-type multidrug transport system ATPase subunit